jgi:iron(III) transport system substrate-binding protein
MVVLPQEDSVMKCGMQSAECGVAERGHPGRSGFDSSKHVGPLWIFMVNRCCCGQDGRAPANTFGRLPPRNRISNFKFQISNLLLAVVCLLVACTQPAQSTVVVYTSQDQVYAEPILNEFSRETGIKVGAVYDSEAVKTVGLVNRLLAERNHPQCDVFWNNEELRTHQLARQSVFREENPWCSVGFRSRRIVVNTNHLSLASAPSTLHELTNSMWRGKIVLAYPLFGTTATHFLALRQQWGEARWKAWCQALLANQPMLVDGNSVVVKLVGRGERWIGLTDSDDIAAGQREGMTIAAMPITEETLLIPNTVAVTRNAPHASAAQKVFEYMQRPDVVRQLVAAKAIEGLSPGEISTPTLKPNWSALVHELDAGTMQLKEIFLR